MKFDKHILPEFGNTPCCDLSAGKINTFKKSLQKVFLQAMKKCGRCRRYVRGKNGKRDELAVRVLYCRNCKHHHRELPDFVVPHKHFGAEVFAAVCDALGNYFIDDHSASRMLRWVKAFFKLGLATVRRLKRKRQPIPPTTKPSRE